MIKIWLLITMLSVQGWPSVKTTSEVWFSEEECQMKRVKDERELEKAALQSGVEAFWFDSWCLETDMFIVKR